MISDGARFFFYDFGDTLRLPASYQKGSIFHGTAQPPSLPKSMWALSLSFSATTWHVQRAHDEALGHEALGREALDHEALGHEALGHEAFGHEAPGHEALG